VSQLSTSVDLEIAEIDFAQLDSPFRGFWAYNSSSTVLDPARDNGFAQFCTIRTLKQDESTDKMTDDRFEG